MQFQKTKEDNAIILDFLPNGYPFDKTPIHRKSPIAQAMGEKYFSLLELVPKKDVFLTQNQKVYIGEDKRKHIHHINGKLSLNRLTETAKAEMKFVINDIISNNEQQFIDFFNKSQPLSTRMHTLELLPGLGKKHMWEIVEKRKSEPFKSFEDIKKRVRLLSDPKKLIRKRIILEIGGNEKYRLFVRE